MNKYYKGKRSNNLFDHNANQPFKLSRTKIELFLNCARCFYLDRKLGIAQPPGFPFSLNNAVDTLLKKEFDLHRAKGNPHPLMKTYGIEAIPFAHPKLAEWRDALRGGIQFLHQKTNLLITGGIDDLWVNPKDELIVVDYKATAKTNEVNIDADWQITFKRQMEIYQWLFRQNSFKVSNTGYFVYVNGKTDAKAFDAKLEFDVKLIPYNGNDSWVEPTIIDIHQCLLNNKLPKPAAGCEFCAYRAAAKTVEP
jgi:hypothetical protein